MRIIDADALKQNIEIWREQLVDTYGINDEYVMCLGSVIDYIDDAPTEEERKKGKWKDYPIAEPKVCRNCPNRLGASCKYRVCNCTLGDNIIY